MGDRYVVDVALAQAGAGDPHESAILLHGGNVRVTGVAHGRAQTAPHMMGGYVEPPAVGVAAHDTCGQPHTGTQRSEEGEKRRWSAHE